MQKIFYISLLLFICLASCSPTTISPTATFIPAQDFSTALSPTLISPQNIILRTPEILDEIPTDLSFYGTLLINGYEDNPSYFFNLKDKSTKIISDSYYRVQASPDGKIVAYFEQQENPDNLIITNDFETEKIIPWNENWHLNGIGINGNLFILNKRADSPPSYMLVNPNNNETTEIEPIFPDIETIYYAAEWWLPVYSPDGTKVIYPRVSQTSRIVLWDIEKQKIITTLSSINNPYGLEPVWSPNGKQFVMALENMYVENLDYPTHELFLGNDSGQTRQLTYLTNFFNSTVRIENYSWSPDNIHIAFQVANGESAQLAVMNTATNEFIVYKLNGYFVHHDPVWSPDGKLILIDGYFEYPSNYWTLIVDLDKNRVIKIAANSFPVSWLSKTSNVF